MSASYYTSIFAQFLPENGAIGGKFEGILPESMQV